MKRLIGVAVLLAPFLLAAPSVAAQVAPPTLTGEAFSSAGTATTVTSASCDPNGTSSFTYQTSGFATGPYNGTYTETGMVTVGPQPLVPGVFSAPGGIVTSWSASFTIQSTAPAAIVTGTKSLLPAPPGHSPDISGICENGTRGIPGFPPFAEQYAANGLVSNQLLGYSATISLGGGGQYEDSGTSRGFLSVIPVAPTATGFNEVYLSQQLETIPLCDEDSQTDQNQVGNDQGCANP